MGGEESSVIMLCATGLDVAQSQSTISVDCITVLFIQWLLESVVQLYLV